MTLKLAYVYGDRIPAYEPIVERWISDEYVVEWIKYETYRKLSDYWDMGFASDNSVFDSVYKYKRYSIEGLDPVELNLESAKNFNDLKNVLLFTLYTYNSMLLPRVSLDYIKEKYTEYCEDKDILEYFKEVLQSLPSCITSLNAYSLRVAIELGIIQKEMLGKVNILNKDKEHIEHVFHSLWKCFEIYNDRVIKDSFYSTVFTEDDVYAFRSATEFSVKKRYLVYEMKHCTRFPAELASEFAEVDAEEFTENEFYNVASKLWEGYNLRLKRVWFEAVMRGFYIPVFMKKKLG